jgi:hypothetical protein
MIRTGVIELVGCVVAWDEQTGRTMHTPARNAERARVCEPILARVLERDLERDLTRRAEAARLGRL